jgi:aminomethyltransferase
MTTTTTTLARTPFYQFHLDHGAKMVDFTGWDMPLHYGSILDEHKQVRSSGGLFDVSHMGRLRFTGRDACKFLDYICTRQIHGMTPGQVRYSMVCNERGGCKDDVLVYCRAEADYLMVCNAANRQKILDHIAANKGEHVFKLSDQTTQTAMIAVQGPKVLELMSRFTREVAGLKRYRFIEKSMLVARIMISRTGYTGEDGVEVILPSMFAGQALKMLLSNLPGGLDAPDAIVKPAGLGARDSLRLEAGMALYGHEITEEIDPISAGIDFAVKLNKGEDDPAVGRFIGQDALQKIAAEGPKRKIVGLILEGKRSARQSMVVMQGDTQVGEITSGCFSPTLEQSIATAYIKAELAEPGTVLQVNLGRVAVDAKVTKLPFYSAR